jgi:hypothetical protein
MIHLLNDCQIVSFGWVYNLCMCLFVSFLCVGFPEYSYSSMTYMSAISGKIYASPLVGENQRKKGEPSYEK